MPPRKPQRGRAEPSHCSQAAQDVLSEWWREPSPGATSLPGSSTSCLPQCLWGPWLSVKGGKSAPCGRGRDSGVLEPVEVQRLLTWLSPRFCSHTPLHTHAHIHAHIWTNDHTSEGVCITLTKARTGSQKSPPPQVSESLPPTTVGLSTGTWVLCSRWTGPRDTCRAVLASLGGSPGPPRAGLRKGVTLARPR